MRSATWSQSSARAVFTIALAAVAIVLASAAPARAGTPTTTLSFNDSRALGTVDSGVTANDSDRTPLVNHLKSMAPGTADATGGQTYTRLNHDLGLLPLAEYLVSGTGNTIVAFGGPAYIYAKYDGPSDSAWVWYIGGLSGTIGIPGVSPILNGLSDWSLFSPVQYRPDARIKRSGGPLLGNDVYNADGAGQTANLKMYAGGKRIAYITVQNDGAQTDTFTVATNAGSATGFTIRYYVGRTSTEITSAIEAGSFVTPPLAPGATYKLRVSASVSKATPRGSHIDRLVTATSVTNATTADTVGFVVRRK